MIYAYSRPRYQVSVYRTIGSLVCNSEAMTSFPHNLILDSQPFFGFTHSELLKLYNFLINL